MSMSPNKLRIVQVSALRFGVEQLATVTEATGRLWWTRTRTRQEWQPWGKVCDLSNTLLHSRYGTRYSDIVRRYFDSIAEAEAYIEESRKPYPIVVKDPA